MFKVDTPQGERFMVQLVGPASYRMGALMAYRGQTLTVQKRTRDYLVRKTNGAWKDFDPTPPEPVDEILPPQFGEEGGPAIDLDDIDPGANPPMSMAHAMQLAGRGAGKEVPSNAGPVQMTEDDIPGIDTADLAQAPSGAPAAPQEAGDISGADLKGGKAPASGGASAASPAKASGKGGVKMTTKPKATAQATPKPAAAPVEDEEAQTVS